MKLTGSLKVRGSCSWGTWTPLLGKQRTWKPRFPTYSIFFFIPFFKSSLLSFFLVDCGDAGDWRCDCVRGGGLCGHQWGLSGLDPELETAALDSHLSHFISSSCEVSFGLRPEATQEGCERDSGNRLLYEPELLCHPRPGPTVLIIVFAICDGRRESAAERGSQARICGATPGKEFVSCPCFQVGSTASDPSEILVAWVIFTNSLSRTR